MKNQNGVYSVTVDENYLQHHGILGQKHGVRNGPPYPLSEGSHSASERKAGWKKSLSGENKGLTDSQKKVIKNTIKTGAAAAGIALATVGAYKTGAINKIGEVGKIAAYNLGKGLGSGIGKGAYKSGEKVSEILVGGMATLSLIEIADLMTKGEATNTLLTAYNAVQKKENKVNINDLQKLEKRKEK